MLTTHTSHMGVVIFLKGKLQFFNFLVIAEIAIYWNFSRFEEILKENKTPILKVKQHPFRA